MVQPQQPDVQRRLLGKELVVQREAAGGGVAADEEGNGAARVGIGDGRDERADLQQHRLVAQPAGQRDGNDAAPRAAAGERARAATFVQGSRFIVNTVLIQLY